MGGKFQKRYDRLMTRACNAEALAAEFQKENLGLRELLSSYEKLVSKYVQALRTLKGKGQLNGK